MSFNIKVNDWGERFIEDINRTCFSDRSSSDYFSRYPIADFSQADTLFIIVGSDSGLLLDFAAKSGLGIGSRIVCIEPDKVFEYLVGQNRLARFVCPPVSNSTIGLYCESKWYDEVFDEDDFRWFLAGNVVVEESHGSRSDYLNIYMPLLRDTKKRVEGRKFNMKIRIQSRAFTNVQISNAADNHSPLQKSTVFGHGYTAVVLGGGPSFDESIDWIIKHQDQLFIIAVSRLCEHLQSLSLKPDMVVSIDPLQYSFDVGKHGLLWHDVPLVASYHACPALIQQWRGPHFTLGARLPWQRADGITYDNVVSTAGPSVGHTCIRVASQLGFTQILLCGIDFCYSAKLNTHAKDSPESILQSLPSMCDDHLETYNGRIAGSQARLVYEWEALKRIGNSVNKHQPVIYNLSENAARVESIPLRPISEVVLPESKPDLSELVNDNACSDKIEDLVKLQREVDIAKRGFQRIYKLAKHADTIIDQLYNTQNEALTSNPLDKLDKLEEILSKYFDKYMRVIRYYSAKQFTATQKPSGFEGMNDEDKQQWIRAYYKITADSSIQFLTRLEKLLDRMQIRQREYSVNPDTEALLSDWDRDRTPGRVLRFLEVGDLTDSSQLLSRSEHCIHASPGMMQKALGFLEVLSNKDTELAKGLQSDNDDITNNMRTVLYLFNTKKSDDLRTLISNLEGNAWPASVLAHFCNGLLSALEDNHAGSVGHFQQVIDACGDRLESGKSALASIIRLLEETLSRMTQCYLSLNDPSSACTTMGTLCELLPRYIASYAKLLHLTDNSQAAIELLTCYLDNYQDEWHAAIVLADIHESLGQSEQAALAAAFSNRIRENLTGDPSEKRRSSGHALLHKAS